MFDKQTNISQECHQPITLICYKLLLIETVDNKHNESPSNNKPDHILLTSANIKLTNS